jgi:arylsulfatase
MGGCAEYITVNANYKPPFAFAGKLGKLGIKVDRPQLSEADIEKLKAAQTNNSSSE